MKELRGFFYRIPIGHIGGYFVKEPWVFTSKIPTGHSSGHITNKTREFTHKIPTGYLGGYFVKVIGVFIHNVPSVLGACYNLFLGVPCTIKDIPWGGSISISMS